MMKWRFLALVLCAAALPGCDPDPMCTLMGCSSELTVELTGAASTYQAVLPVTVELCFDASLCADYELSADGSCAPVEPSYPGCSTSNSNVVLHLRLGGTSYSTTQSYDVQVVLRDANGADLYDATQGVTLDANSPNGADCGPTCYSGTVLFEPT